MAPFVGARLWLASVGAGPRAITMSIDGLRVVVDGEQRSVHFFKSFSGYSHPVMPREPMFFEEALLRSSHARAWSAVRGSETVFLRFESVSLERRPLGEHAGEADGVQFWSTAGAAGSEIPTFAITAAQAIALPVFALSMRATGLCVVRQTPLISYNYAYGPGYRLETVTITNPEGKVNMLKY